jgi:hypothetical protein
MKISTTSGIVFIYILICPIKSHIYTFKNILGAGMVARAVEYLPSKHEAFSSNPSTTKKKKKERENKLKLLQTLFSFKGKMLS